MIRRLRKLSWDGHRLLVRWEQARAGEWDEYELHCGQVPLPDLLTALQALTASVSKICELEPKYCGEGFALRGVSISYTEADVMGATITALKYLKTARAPLVLNTPHLMAEPMSETDEAPLLPAETVEAIAALELEAWRYVAGERAQGDLFAGEQGKVAAAGGGRAVPAAVVEAAARLAPEPGSGISEVTLSMGDKSVTLHQGDGERIRQGLGVVRGGKRGKGR